MGKLARATVSSHEGNSAERRGEPRSSLGRPGTMRIGDAGSIEASITDLTREGCRLIVDIDLAPGQEVQVGIAHLGLIAGRIVWHGEHGYGCQFDTPLLPGAVTLASGPSNVVMLARSQSELPYAAAPVKIGARTRLLVIVAVALFCWSIIVTLGVLFLSSGQDAWM